MFVYLCTWVNKLACSAGCQEASMCYTRGESVDITGDKVCEGSTIALKPSADVTRSHQQWYQWPHKMDLYPPIFFLKLLNY